MVDGVKRLLAMVKVLPAEPPLDRIANGMHVSSGPLYLMKNWRPPKWLRLRCVPPHPPPPNQTRRRRHPHPWRRLLPSQLCPSLPPGTAFYSIQGSINHSCDPNAYAFKSPQVSAVERCWSHARHCRVGRKRSVACKIAVPVAQAGSLSQCADCETPMVG